jgi:nucleotide-binding universal stress UspA family protein
MGRRLDSPRVRRILHPTDFSNGARKAESEAVRLARTLDAELLLLHVVPEVYLYGRGRVKIAERLQLQAIRVAAGRRALAHRVSQLRSRGVRVKGLVLSGSPRAKTVAIARRARCDMIVMGTRGGNALSRWLLGSVADRVVRRAACPVLTVRK